MNTQQGVIILVHDDLLAAFVRYVLEISGYQIHMAADPVDALRLIRGGTQPAHLLLTNSPDWNPKHEEFIRGVRSLAPEMPVLLICNESRVSPQPYCEKIQIPFRMHELSQMVGLLLGLAAWHHGTAGPGAARHSFAGNAPPDQYPLRMAAAS